MGATVALLLLSSCTRSSAVDSLERAQPTVPITSTAAPTEDSGSSAPLPDQDAAAPDTPKPVAAPYVPAGQPGTNGAYQDLVARLEQEVPTELQSQVPWPDLRNPNPIVAQIDIFELWVWMSANHPDPLLVEAISAPGSPSREEVVSVFGDQNSRDQLKTRTGARYQAFDHVVVTFESAGLPLWLARDVPEHAVVVYYRDTSGPIEVTDRITGELVEILDAVPARAWLSIMVPTDVGWQLWRDQLIEPNDAELQFPELPAPGDQDQRPKPEV